MLPRKAADLVYRKLHARAFLPIIHESRRIVEWKRGSEIVARWFDKEGLLCYS